MNHTEFKKASMRHFQSCKILLDSIEKNKSDASKIIHNIYYLSGYVIETSLNYAFYSTCKHKGEVEQHHLYVKNALKNHNFEIKIKYIKQYGGDISSLPLISNNMSKPELYRLYNKWSTDLRYHYSDTKLIITIDLIKRYLEEIKNFHRIILTRF